MAAAILVCSISIAKTRDEKLNWYVSCDYACDYVDLVLHYIVSVVIVIAIVRKTKTSDPYDYDAVTTTLITSTILIFTAF